VGGRAALGVVPNTGARGHIRSGAGRGDQLANIPLEPTPGGPLTRPAGFPRSVVSWLARRGSAATLCRSTKRRRKPIGWRLGLQLRMGSAKGSRESQETRSVLRRGHYSVWDPLSLNMPDPDHSEDEERFIVLGTSVRLRRVVVSYTDRTPRTRIISARLATRRERRQYEEQKK